MRRIVLTRTELAKSHTRGVLEVDSEAPFAVLERPWLNNQHDISCIPAGLYTLIQFNHEKWGVTWYFKHVPDRSEVMLHWGNLVKHSRGCPIIGGIYAMQSAVPMLLAPAEKAFNRFRAACLKERQMELLIQEVSPCISTPEKSAPS